MPTDSSLETMLQTLLPTQQIRTCTPMAAQGYSNQSYLLTTDKERYFLRLFDPSSINRGSEYQIQQLAHSVGIAPKPVAVDIDQGIMLSAFVQGTHTQTLTPPQLAQLAQTLLRLHTLPPEGASTTFQVDTAIIQDFAYEPALCHNDLNPHNILWKHHTPILIDWEYAGINDRYFDLAAVINEFGLKDTEKQRLLHLYCKESDGCNQEKLDAYIRLYRDVCAQWWRDHTIEPPSSTAQS